MKTFFIADVDKSTAVEQHLRPRKSAIDGRHVQGGSAVFRL